MPLGIRALPAVLAVFLALAAAGCGRGSSPQVPQGPGTGRPPVVIGSQNFTEQRILGELYSQALRAKGYRVRLQRELPSRAAADRALVDGRIDGYSDYVVAFLDTIVGPAPAPISSHAAVRAVREREARRGFAVLAPAPLARTDALATTFAYARHHDLHDVAGLARAGRFTLGAVPSFDIRATGLEAVKRAYGITDVEFKPLSLGAGYGALDSGRVQVAAVSSTDARLRTGRYAVLGDPKHAFGFGNVVPVFARQVVTAEGAAFSRTVNSVSAKLTTPAMQRMNAAAEVGKRSPADVARRFLRANGLL